MAVPHGCGENSSEQRRQMRVRKAAMVRGGFLIELRSSATVQLAGTKHRNALTAMQVFVDQCLNFKYNEPMSHETNHIFEKKTVRSK